MTKFQWLPAWVPVRRAFHGRQPLLVILLAFFMPVALQAQTGGGLAGHVVDSSGAYIPKALVRIVSASGHVWQTQTDPHGDYAIHHLPPGRYQVTITALNFQPYQASGIEIAAGRIRRLDARLPLESLQQNVVVRGHAQRLSLSPGKNASAMVVRGAALNALSNDPDVLTDELQAMAGPVAGPGGGQIYVNGMAMSGDMPPKSQILEVHINRNPFTAAHAHLGYGRVDIITKPGAQKFHGEGFVFGTFSGLNARNPFAPHEPAYHDLFYHGDLGGPLGKKAAFFFDAFHRASQFVSVIDAFTLNSSYQPTLLAEAISTPQTFTRISPRLNFQLSNNNVLAVEYHQNWGSFPNSGIGLFNLPSQGYFRLHHEYGVSVLDTQIVSPETINSLHFFVGHEFNRQTPNASETPTLNVRGAFLGGGNQQGNYQENHWNTWLADDVNMTHGSQSISFGGRLHQYHDFLNSPQGFNGEFIFPSLDAYRITVQGQAQGESMSQIRAAGGGPSQYTVTAGNPINTVSLFDLAFYGEDTWKALPNLSLSLGLRLETQNHISDHADFAPRFGLAWGLDKRRKTVFRAGFGLFYSRIWRDTILQVEQLNGVHQQQYIVNQPDFYPQAPPPSSLSGSATFPSIYELDSRLQAPYVIESALSLERQVTRNLNTSVTYIFSHGAHQLMLRNINAPLPGTYDPSNPSSGVRPLGNIGNVNQYETVGNFNESQMIANFRLNAGAGISAFGNYTLSFANSDPLGTFPMNQYDIAADYGPAGFVVRHRLFVGSTFSLPYSAQLSSFLLFNSGRPYNITLGEDLNGDSIFNDRPAYAAPGATGPNIVVTPLGAFNAAPGPNQPRVPINALTGPSNFSVNLRLSKTFGFGGRIHGHGGGGGFHHDDHRRGLRNGLGGGRGGFFHPGGAADRRYKLTVSLTARNIFNQVNLGTPIGTLSSPLFGQSNSLAGGFFGHNTLPWNRSLFAMLRFSF